MAHSHSVAQFGEKGLEFCGTLHIVVQFGEQGLGFCDTLHSVAQFGKQGLEFCGTLTHSIVWHDLLSRG